ncbi:MAG: hypothetical protein Q9195_005969 [Heterodermia aff. obscurata]
MSYDGNEDGGKEASIIPAKDGDFYAVHYENVQLAGDDRRKYLKARVRRTFGDEKPSGKGGNAVKGQRVPDQFDRPVLQTSIEKQTSVKKQNKKGGKSTRSSKRLQKIPAESDEEEQAPETAAPSNEDDDSLSYNEGQKMEDKLARDRQLLIDDEAQEDENLQDLPQT